MSTWRRFGVAVFWTVGLMIGGLLYNEVFVEGMINTAEVPTDGTYGTPVGWLESLVPIIIVGLLLAVWAWVIAGGVEEERTVDRRRVRR